MVHSVFSENKSSGSAGINGVWEDFWQQCRHYYYLTIIPSYSTSSLFS